MFCTLSDEPSPKRTRHQCTLTQSNRSSSELSQSQIKSGSASPNKLDSCNDRVMEYGAELVVYDKHRRCLLTEGEYELVLQDLTAKKTSKKLATWETIMDGKVHIGYG